jgi:hypothetical protein
VSARVIASTVVALATLVTARVAAAQAARCPEPKLRVTLEWPSPSARPTVARCLNIAEFLAMFRARNAWRCTAPSASREARCVAVIARRSP